MEGNVVLTMRDISKTFPGVKALQHVDFTLRKGEIHALMGENGAGKSTLIKVLTGVHEFENGEIRLDGKDGPIINKSPQDAQNNGISTVYQEVNLCPNLTVAENLFIGREPRKAGFIDWRTMNKRATELLKSLEIDASATQKLEEVSLARQQMIAIARAVDISTARAIAIICCLARETSSSFWVAEASISRLLSNSVARLFIVRQSINPAFLGSRPINRFSATVRFGQRLTS